MQQALPALERQGRMSIVEMTKRAIAILATTVGACLAAPAWAEDWRALRPIDLPAELVRATWDEQSFLADGHPMPFGRTTVYMLPTDTVKKFIAKSSGTAGGGIMVEDLTCYNAVRGSRFCALLLNPPNRCYLIVRGPPGSSNSDFFDIGCPVDLTLGR